MGIFFTLNGAPVSPPTYARSALEAELGVDLCFVERLPQEPLWPVVGLDSYQPVTLRFGAAAGQTGSEPFMFTGLAHIDATLVRRNLVPACPSSRQPWHAAVLGRAGGFPSAAGRQAAPKRRRVRVP